MKLRITMTMEGDAFEDQGTEAARILRKLADRLDGQPYLGGLNLRLLDFYGNRAGEVVTTKRRSK